MLDAFIIDELKRREVEERDDAGRPRLEIPVPDDDAEHDHGDSEPNGEDGDEKKSDRGVVKIDL